MAKQIVFIHGMFMNPRSWEKWVGHFTQAGYECRAPAWPLHKGEPKELRAHLPPGLGDLTFAGVVERMRRELAQLEEPPILIGHSVGGLVTQVLVNQGLGAAGICISSVPPNGMLSLQWEFLKSNVPILNPIKGDVPQEMTPAFFHETFGNMLSEEEAQKDFERYAVHESRNVLRSALGKAACVDMEKPHAPLLFLSGRENRVIPAALVEKNFDAYANAVGTKSIHLFRDRGHHICNEPGWLEVAQYVEGWLSQHGSRHPGLARAERQMGPLVIL